MKPTRTKPGIALRPAGEQGSGAGFAPGAIFMKILCIHAHFDDFEFTAGGLFALWRRALGESLEAKVIVCTDGKAGHHFRTREETGAIRLAEQEASARAGGYVFENLRLPDGRVPREACLSVDIPLLAALWKAIRDFEPDYLFCPPVPADPLAGIHVDHVAVAEAVRKVAYMINVPHAFTPEYPADETAARPCKVPAILNVYDSYMSGANSFDLVIDVEPVVDEVAECAWCHQSQIVEWLPWVARHGMSPPADLEAWKAAFRRRSEQRKRELDIRRPGAVEVFTVTAWGSVPEAEDLLDDFPGVDLNASRLDNMKAKMARWAPGW